MKPKSSRRFFAAAAITSVLALSSSAFAGTLYWDGLADVTLSSSDNINTGAQDWLSGGLWDNGTTSAALGSWTAGDDAVFGGSATSQTITAGTFTVGNMTFGSGALGAGTSGTAYTITGGAITLGTSTITTNTNTTIATNLLGSTKTLTKAGNGTLVLSGTGNDWTGVTTINAGTLSITGTAKIHTTTGGNWQTVINTGGTLEVTSLAYGANLGQNWSDAANFYLNGGTVRILTTSNADRRIDLSAGGGTFEIATGATVTHSKGINGSGALTKTGAGTLILSSGNGYTGLTKVDNGKLTVTGGTLRTTSGLTVNAGATAEFTSGNIFTAGHGSAMDNAKVLTANNGGILLMTSTAENRIGNVTLNNGSTWTSNRAVSAGGYDILLANTGSTGGGAATVSVTGNAASTMNGSGGIHLLGIQNFAVADVTSSAAVDLTVSMILGNQGNGGGTGGINKTGLGTMALTGNNTYSGGTTLNAGTIAVNSATSLGTSAGALTFTGNSTLQALASFSGTRTSTINSGITGTFDTNGFNLTQTGGISGTGGLLTKIGAGTLTLGGTNSYTGATAVNVGKLVLNGTNTSNISVLSVAAFGGSGSTTGSLTLANGATYAYGGGAFTASGGITLSGSNVVTFDAAPTAGTIDILKYTGSTLTGAVNFSTTQARAVFADDSANQKITATVSTENNIWTGSTGNWDVGISTNWSNGSDSKFFAGDSVTFNNTGAGTVNLVGTLAASAVTVDSTADYTFSGTGVISGTSELSKSGTGKLTISTANTYTGGTAINGGGILSVSAIADGGTSNIGTSGYLGLNNGTLEYTGTGSSTTGRALWVNTASGSGTFDITNAGGTLAFTGTPGSTMNQAIIKRGAGTMTSTREISGATGSVTVEAGTLGLSATNTYTGGTTINGGVLDLTGGGGSVGAIRGTATVNTGGILRLSTSDATGYSGGANSLNTINLVGGTLHVNTTANQTLGSATINMTGGSITGIGGSNLDFFGGSSALNTLESSNSSTISLPTMNLRQNDTLFTIADGLAANDLVISSIIGNGDAGNHNMIKTGLGTMLLSGNNTFTGSVTVNVGIIKMGGAAGTKSLGAFNTAVTKVVVGDGGTIDFNGVEELTYGYTIAGTGANGTGALVNTGAAIGNGKAQASNIKLSADASIGGALTNDWALLTSGWNATSLDLNGKTLTKTGANTISLVSTTTTAGNVRISNGILALGATDGGSGVAGSTSAFSLDNTAGATLSVVRNSSVGSLAGGGTTGGNVTLASGTSIAVGALNSSTTYDGVISGAGAFTKTGTGILTLTGANTYTGVTTIRGNNGTNGAVSVSSIGNGGVAGNLGQATNIAANLIFGQSGISTGKLTYTGAGESTDRLFTLDGNAIIENDGTGALNFTNTGAIAHGGGSHNLNLGGSYTGAANTFTSQIVDGSGTTNLNKDGAGTWILDGTNTYGGVTNVNVGKLVINGDNSGATGAVTVASGATLAGNGTVGGATTIQSGGIHGPGNSPDVQKFTSDLTYSSGSIFSWDLASLTTSGRGTAFDGVDVGGNLTIDSTLGTGSIFQIVLGTSGSEDNAFWNSTQTWTGVFDVTGTTTGSFTNFQVVDSGFNSTSIAQLGSFTYNGGTGSLVWSAVPEPTSALAGLLLGAGLLRRRRRVA